MNKNILEWNSLGNSWSEIGFHMENRICGLIYARQEMQLSFLRWQQQFSRKKLDGFVSNCTASYTGVLN
jgi:hypothetical protein